MKVPLINKPNAALQSPGKITRKLSLTNTRCKTIQRHPFQPLTNSILLFSFHKIHQYFPRRGMKLDIFHPTLNISLLNQKPLVQRKNHA